MATLNNGIPLVNGYLYDWACVTVTIGGVPLTGITGIEYKDEQDVVNKYGAGRHPVGRAYGNITPSAKITLYQEVVEQLSSQSDTGRLQDIEPFDVLVSYIPKDSAIVKTDKIRNCSFKDNGRTWKQGDTAPEIELELLPSHIEWAK